MADKLKIDIDINAASAIKELLHVQQWVKQADESAKAMNRTLGEVNASMRSLGAELTKVSAETHKLREVNNAAAEKLADLRSKTGLLTGDISTLGERVRTISPQWGTMATTALGAFARISAGVAGVATAMTAGAMQIGRMAAEAERSERAAQILGRAFEQVRSATADTVTAQQALALQQGLVQSGLQVTGEQLGRIAARAREYAHATGGETNDALGQMLDTLRGLESEGLRRFGVTLTTTGDRQRDFNQVVDQLAGSARAAQRETEKWGDATERAGAQAQTLQTTLSASSRTMAEEVERTSGSFTRLTNNIAAALARALDLQEVFQFWSDHLDPNTNNRRIAADRQRIRGDAATQERNNTRTALRQLADRGYRVDMLDRYAANENTSLDDLARIRAQTRVALEQADMPNAGVRVRAAMRGLGDLPGMQRMIQEEGNQLDRDATQRENERKQRKPQSTTTDAAAVSAQRDLNRAIAEALVRGAPRVPIGRPTRGETMADYLQRLTAMQRQLTSGALTPAQMDELAARGAEMDEEAAGTARGKAEAAFAEQRAGTTRDRERFQRISARDRETRRRARTESFGGELASALGYETDDEGRIKGLDAQKAGVGMLQSAVQTLQGNLSQLFNTIVSGSMSAADAFQMFASRTLSSLGEMAMNKGLFYTFEGVAALFSNPPAAPLYFAAGAGLLALGAGLGYAGAAIAPQSAQSTGAASTGAARAASGSSRGSLTQEQAAPVTVVMSSLVPAGPADAQRARDGLRHARRQGFDDRLPRRIEF